MTSTEKKPLFRDLNAEDPDPEVTQIESFCVNCYANGMTRLLLTRIPHYKNVVIMSFSCEHCGFENNEIQGGGAFAELGVRWKLQVEEPIDLNRQVVKSDFTSVSIPELDFEIPAKSQKGEVTTVEGILARAIDGLSQDQELRVKQHPDTAAQIDQFISRLQALRRLETKWTLVLEDVSGNTFVENPSAPHKDPRCVRTDFNRDNEQNHTLGIYLNDEMKSADTGLPGVVSPADPSQGCYERLSAEEVMQFPTNCPDCNAPADTNMKLTKIPHFKEVVIMATVCDSCGHRTNEVKSGGGIEEKGVRFEVRIANKEDFSRDVLKSETCSMQIPELDLDVGGRALGGRFTTAEGLLRSTIEQLANAPALTGDAPTCVDSDTMNQFITKLEEVIDGKRAITLILDDPAGNSYVQNLNDDPTHYDDGLKVTYYERSFEQNEELGINDMKTEGYEDAS
ncbi:zinc finger protein ZPR1 [Leptidea sinapis]|uniref:zinc finger protein ZPR1 n=1 Tax=Leptidea sinapis TaxID=189913 RepID=UPI002139E18A|nr:zinc finger protein ZPR1 [Leptidea sinapis]